LAVAPFIIHYSGWQHPEICAFAGAKGIDSKWDRKPHAIVGIDQAKVNASIPVPLGTRAPS
jgi:hypothetical protein